jgi:hypothetical protein
MTTIVLREDLEITRGTTVARPTSPRSTEHRCAKCESTLYVESTRFPVTVILRPGTLDDSSVAIPQAHIYVSRKQSWVVLPANVPQFDEQYDPSTVWPASSLARLRAAERGR